MVVRLEDIQCYSAGTQWWIFIPLEHRPGNANLQSVIPKAAMVPLVCCHPSCVVGHQTVTHMLLGLHQMQPFDWLTMTTRFLFFSLLEHQMQLEGKNCLKVNPVELLVLQPALVISLGKVFGYYFTMMWFLAIPTSLYIF